MKQFLRISSVGYFVALLAMSLTKLYYDHSYGQTEEMSDNPEENHNWHSVIWWILILSFLYAGVVYVVLLAAILNLSKRLKYIGTALFAVIVFCLFILPMTELPNQEQIFLLFYPALIGALGISIYGYSKMYPNIKYDLLVLGFLFVLHASLAYFTNLYGWILG